MKLRSIFHTPQTRFYLGIGASLLIHGLILLFYLDRPPLQLTETGNAGLAPMQVQLLTPASPPVRKTVLAPPAPDKIVKPRAPTPTRKPPVQPETQAPTTLPPAPVAEKKFDPNLDMSDMLAAARERRRAAGIPEPESSRQTPQDESAVARANVQELMNQQARGRNESGGVFQITHKGVRNAEFIFRGWNTRRNNTTRQLIQVDAGLGGDIDTAIVRRMIDIIRQTERGDFQWESHRLGRVITLSARLSDTDALEAFLKREFLE